MFSILNPSIVYTNLSSDITEHDIDVVSDLWTMDNREVYRGSRDPTYTHANVYWLYNEELERVGLAEHDLTNHGDVRLLWFYDNAFATLLQEEDWEVSDSVWSVLPRNVVDLFLSRGWTTPTQMLENCLASNVRILSPDLLVNIPPLYHCESCKKSSLKPIHPESVAGKIPFPEKEKILFLDADMIVHIPPVNSRVWEMIMPQSPLVDDSSPEQVPEPEHYTQPSPPQSPEPPHDPVPLQ